MPSREGPHGEEVQVHITGLPHPYKEGMRSASDLVNGMRRGRLKRVYCEAVSSFLEEVEKENEVSLLSSSKKGGRMIIWLPEPLVTRMENFCNRTGSFRNAFLLTAIHKYLQSKDML